MPRRSKQGQWSKNIEKLIVTASLASSEVTISWAATSPHQLTQVKSLRPHYLTRQVFNNRNCW